jgi:O-methyltransferase
MKNDVMASSNMADTSNVSNFRWWAKKILPKSVVDLLRKILPESVYYPGYGQTTLSDPKIKNIVSLLDECLRNKLEGEIIECGVFRGGSLVQIGLTLKKSRLKKRIHGVDTFEGHPYQSQEDVRQDGKVTHHQGLFSGNQIEKVQESLQKYLLDNVTLHKGMVEDILPGFSNHQFCFAHLDMDLYQSTKSALTIIAPRMVKGGIICFDDYGDPEAPGVKKAADEILGSENMKTTLDSKDGHQAYWKNTGESHK